MFDLCQELRRNRPRVAEDTERHLAVVEWVVAMARENVLNRLGVRNDRALVMFSRP